MRVGTMNWTTQVPIRRGAIEFRRVRPISRGRH